MNIFELTIVMWLGAALVLYLLCRIFPSLNAPFTLTEEQQFSQIQLGLGLKKKTLPKKKAKKEDLPAFCVICQSGIESAEDITELLCTHVYHSGCIEEWFKTADTATCCLCRRVPPAHWTEESIVQTLIAQS
eukprot:TRINITY_DN7812_c0_g1_i1.p1 TRINITY_DN7812_c0_g1~~TRINITY_DN7812_c0_g1_i1.p1  ORF type:complete len:132 (+),score=8.59 TRINITY_DN7812_c0_g1_i1:315-710(+)